MAPRAIWAERVPVIMMASRFKLVLSPSSSTVADMRARSSSNSENGNVQTTNSAKKLRLTKVDAGLGPCGNSFMSNQNCSAVHSEATTAPAWMLVAIMGTCSRLKLLSPSQSNSPRMNQRMASPPPR